MLAPAALLTLGACSSAPQLPVQHPPADIQPDLPKTRLPGNDQTWTSWQCDNAIRIETRYATMNGQQIRLKYQGSEVTLERQPGDNQYMRMKTWLKQTVKHLFSTGLAF